MSLLLLMMETPQEMVTSTPGEEEEDNPIPRCPNLDVHVICSIIYIYKCSIIYIYK